MPGRSFTAGRPGGSGLGHVGSSSAGRGPRRALAGTAASSDQPMRADGSVLPSFERVRDRSANPRHPRARDGVLVGRCRSSSASCSPCVPPLEDSGLEVLAGQSGRRAGASPPRSARGCLAGKWMSRRFKAVCDRPMALDRTVSASSRPSRTGTGSSTGLEMRSWQPESSWTRCRSRWRHYVRRRSAYSCWGGWPSGSRASSTSPRARPGEAARHERVTERYTAVSALVVRPQKIVRKQTVCDRRRAGRVFFRARRPGPT